MARHAYNLTKEITNAHDMGQGGAHTWSARLTAIIQDNIEKHAKRSKQASHETQARRREVLFLCFNQLREMGYMLDNPAGLVEKHVRALVTRWEGEGLSASTLQNRMSILRTFAKWIGKAGLVRSTETYVSNPALVRRKTAATVDKSWDTNGIDIVAAIRGIEQMDRYVAIQLKLMLAFGLRKKEAVMFKPFRSQLGAGVGSVIALHESSGTKGGKSRVIPIENDTQRTVLNEAKFIARTVNGHVSNPNNTLKQNMRRFQYVLERHGLTKDELGVTSHGLRHQFLNDFYQTIAGEASPVRQLATLNTETEIAAVIRPVSSGSTIALFADEGTEITNPTGDRFADAETDAGTVSVVSTVQGQAGRVGSADTTGGKTSLLVSLTGNLAAAVAAGEGDTGTGDQMPLLGADDESALMAAEAGKTADPYAGMAREDRVAMAKLQTSAVAGHVRPGISTAYIGSENAVKREMTARELERDAMRDELLVLMDKDPQTEDDKARMKVLLDALMKATK